MSPPSLAARRAWLLQNGARVSAGLAVAHWGAESQAARVDPADAPVRRGRTLVFPRDHGAHPGSHIEWWYVTGWLQAVVPGPGAVSAAPPARSRVPDAGLIGFQVTFFRSRTGLGEHLRSRLAPRQLLFAHAALTHVAAGTHQHDARIGRWSGHDEPDARVRAVRQDADIAVHGWRLHRQADPSRWVTEIQSRGFTLTLEMARTQPVLLQGRAGFSRKGPQEAQASHYLSEPQLAVSGQMRISGGKAQLQQQVQQVAGRAWLDHEWSDELLHPEAVGWDWIGMNLDDGSALTAFRLRRADGSALWAGGSLRRAGQTEAQDFPPEAVRFEPGRRWRSPSSSGDYPVAWTVSTPAGTFGVQALLDAQELDSRSSTGTVYWEGLSALQDTAGRRIGLGYLEMTGYAGRLVL